MKNTQLPALMLVSKGGLELLQEPYQQVTFRIIYCDLVKIPKNKGSFDVIQKLIVLHSPVDKW